LNKCTAITRGGARCRGVAIDGSRWCYAHSPDYEQERRHNAAKGGRRAGRGRPQLQVSGVRDQLQELADGVRDGSIDRGDGAVVAQILGVLLRATKLELEIQEAQVFAERLEALEAALAQRKGRPYGA
jgi:hypothetical protein